MKVFIVGASGLVGSHCLKYFRDVNVQVIGTHLNYPTTDTIHFDPLIDRDFDVFNTLNFFPDVIIHCGALTNVDYCELNPQESRNLTVASTEVIVNYCQGKGIKFIYISTDYVFDGINGPYGEEAPANPINIYGKHKLEAENKAQELNDFIIARITNVYGEEKRSKNFVANLAKTILAKTTKTFNLPFDQFATPIYAGDIARMLYLLIKDKKQGIYNLASTDYYNRYQLAKKVNSYFNADSSVTLIPMTTLALNQKAQRPLNGGLLNIKFSNTYPDFEFTNIDKFILDIYKHGL